MDQNQMYLNMELQEMFVCFMPNWSSSLTTEKLAAYLVSSGNSNKIVSAIYTFSCFVYACNFGKVISEHPMRGENKNSWLGQSQ